MRTTTRLKVAYGALAATDTLLAGSRRPWAHRLRHVTKPLLLPMLGAAMAADPRARTSSLRTSTTLAQAAGWGGDVLLLGRGDRAFAAGATSFGVGHVGYLSGFRRRRDRRTPVTRTRTARALAGLWAVSGPVVAVAAARRDARLGATVLVYSGLLSTTAICATHLDPALPRDARLMTAAGGLLFLTSDAVLGARTFLLPDPPQPLESVVMATYTAAQFLLAEGAARAGR